MQTTRFSTVHDYCEAQEAAYKLPIDINDSWQWGMRKHINTAILYKNSQLLTRKGEFTPVKNIVRPILNLQYRAEGFDVKDIVLYVDDSKEYYKSFLVKKFHEDWARKNGIDTVIDAMEESYVDFGGALLKNVDDVKPEVVPLQSIAFCDQTDLLSGPIGIKHFYAPDQLLEMADRGWGEEKNGANASLEDTIQLSREEKDSENPSLTKAKTPGKYIEVYEIHGMLPKKFLEPSDTSGKYENQMHIICFYTNNKSNQRGQITLYKTAEKESPFKFISRDPIYGRALGLGGVEEIEDPQVWVNYNAQRKLDMIDSASKTILGAKGSQSSTIANKQKVRDMDNNQIIDLGVDGELSVLDTYPRNLKIFEQSDVEWTEQARWMGAAQEAISGDEPSAGTPFKSVEFQAMESHSLHQYRQGKLATFWADEVLYEWVLPYIAKEISKGKQFLAELDLEELQYVSQAVITCQTNQKIIEKVLSGELVDPADVEGYKEIVGQEFKKQGSQHWLEIFAGEMKNVPIKVKANVAGKQKNLGQKVDKIVNVIRFLASSNPMVLASNGFWDLINQTIEQSGLNPVDFSGVADDIKKAMQQQQQAAQQPMPGQQPPPAPSPLALNAPQNAY